MLTFAPHIPETVPFDRQHIIRLDEVDSTNNYAAKLFNASNPPEGTAILARHQSQGRGQRGSHWESEPGQNLVASFILYPQFLGAADQFHLSRCISLAASDTIRLASGLQAHIKWPNDLLVNRFKVAGILIEINWAGQQLQSAVVGIGINLNQRNFIAPNASSLGAITGEAYVIEEVFDTLFHSVERWYDRLRAEGPQVVCIEYTRRMHALNEPATYSTGANEFRAILRGTDTNGRLQLEMETGELEFYTTHQVRLKY